MPNVYRKKLVHLNSKDLVNGVAKPPLTTDINYGEIAVNYAMQNERVFIKNSNDEIIDFIPEHEIDKKLEFYKGHNVISSISNIPIDKRLVLCNLNVGGPFSLSSVPNDGYEVHIIVKNISASPITIPLPTAAPYITIGKPNISVKGGQIIEINALSDGTSIYLRSN